MPRFSYRGRSGAGSAVQGVLEAPSAEAAAGQLAATGVIPLDIVAAPEAGADVGGRLARALGRDLPSRQDLVLFCRQLHALVRSGVPIIRGLTHLAESTRHRSFSATIGDVIEDLESGRDLGGSMARHPRVFSPLFLAMVRVGEVSGRLDEALLRLYEYLDREIGTVNAIKSALRYPAMVVIALVIAVFVIMGAVIPRFSSFYAKNGLDLPLATRVIVGASQFVADYWYLLLLAAVCATFAVSRYVRTRAGRLWWDRSKLRLPRIGLILIRATLARFARAFAMGVRSGVPILQAIAVAARALDNEHVAGQVLGMREAIERGDNLSRAAARAGVFTPLVLQMIGVGEETGQLEEMLDEVAEFYEREVDYDVKRLSALIEPLLTVAMAGLVLLLALGVFLPMWDLAQMAQR